MNAAPPSSSTSTGRSRRLRALFRLSPRPARILMGGGLLAVLIVVGFMCLLLFGGEGPGDSLVGGLTIFLAGLAMVLSPPVLFFLLLAALWEKRAPPRALLWAAMAIYAGAAGMLLLLLAAVDTKNLGSSLVVLLSGVCPLFLLLSAPAVYFAAQSAPDVRAVLQEDLGERTLALIQGRGCISLEDLAAEVGAPPAEVALLVDDFLNSGRLSAVLYPHHRLIATSAYLDDRQRLLLELVRAQGRVRLEVLARALATAPDILNDWIYQVIQRGQFNGAINWKEGWLYSSTARQIGADSRCPHCGGQLVPTGPGLAGCLHCGSDLFL